MLLSQYNFGPPGYLRQVLSQSFFIKLPPSQSASDLPLFKRDRHAGAIPQILSSHTPAFTAQHWLYEAILFSFASSLPEIYYEHY